MDNVASLDYFITHANVCDNRFNIMPHNVCVAYFVMLRREIGSRGRCKGQAGCSPATYTEQYTANNRLC